MLGPLHPRHPRRLLVAALLLGAASPGVAGPAEAPPAISVEIVPGGLYASARHVGAYADLAGAYPRLLAWIRAGGLTIAGPVQAHYLDDPKNVAVARLRSEALVPLAEPPPGPSPLPPAGISLVRLPPRLVARTLHVGPYADVRPTYERLQRATAPLGVSYRGTMREVYLDDPALVPAAALRTDVSLVVEPSAKTDVGVYAGPGADGPGLRSLSQALFAAGLTQRPLEPETFREGALALAKATRAVLVPGGWAPATIEALGPKGLAGLRDFVRGGGGYVGVCAGAYLATRTVVWDGERLEYPLDLFGGVATGPVVELAPWPGRALAPLVLEGSHPILSGLSGDRRVLYQGGPTFGPEGPGVSVLARFSPGGGAAWIALSCGQGRVVLSSAHLEGDPAPPGATTPPTTLPEGTDPESDRDLLARSTLWVLGKPPTR